MTTYTFISLPKSTIEDFENGRIDENELLEKFASANYIVLDELFEVINCTLAIFAPENPAVPLIGEERSILANADGDALLLDTYHFTDEDDNEGEICEPVGYKTTEEVQTAVQFLQNFEYEDFKKSFSIRTVMQETSFAIYDTQSVIAKQDEICESAYHELQKLGDFYKQSLADQNYVVLTMILDEIDDIEEIDE